MPRDPWNPQVYGRYETQREQPFRDLLALLTPRLGGRVVDIGCGTGKLTAALHGALAARETVGIDPSPAMLEKAQALVASGAPAASGLTFRAGTVEDALTAAPWDAVVSNAALHWVPDHEALFPRLAASLAPGGQLAVQMPWNEGQPITTALDAVLAEEPFVTTLGGFRRARHVLSLEAYATLLRAAGLRGIRLRMEVYVHELAGPEDAVTWVRGGLLTQLEGPLGPELYAELVRRYTTRLLPSFPPQRPFAFLFRRIFVYGVRPAVGRSGEGSGESSDEPSAAPGAPSA